MLLLSPDVFDQIIDVAPGARKRGVSLLPVRKAFEHRVILDPMRRASFDVLHKIRQADGGVQAADDVKVVLHTIDTVKVAVAVLDDAPNVAEGVFAAVRPEGRLTVLCGEDDVIANLRVS